jgi:hypothetical protein
MTPKEIANLITENIDISNGLEEIERPGMGYYIKMVDDVMTKTYGQPKNQAFKQACVKNVVNVLIKTIEAGETDLETLSDLAHRAWAETAKKSNDPNYKERARRLELAATPYSNLPEEEKEKDRVVARTLLTAYNKNLESALGV